MKDIELLALTWWCNLHRKKARALVSDFLKRDVSINPIALKEVNIIAMHELTSPYHLN